MGTRIIARTLSLSLQCVIVRSAMAKSAGQRQRPRVAVLTANGSLSKCGEKKWANQEKKYCPVPKANNQSLRRQVKQESFPVVVGWDGAKCKKVLQQARVTRKLSKTMLAMLHCYRCHAKFSVKEDAHGALSLRCSDRQCGAKIKYPENAYVQSSSKGLK